MRGHVEDNKLHALPFSVVRLERDGQTKPYAVAQSDSNGDFVFSDLPSGNFVLKVDYLGYFPYTSPIHLDSNERKDVLITLQESTNTLGEVKVIATKPLIERLVDKTVINVDGNPIATGNNALDLLSLSPGVIVNNGQIMLNGKTGVSVMIDGKLTYLSRETLNTYLRTLNASEIKQIELITNPSARYDASGTSGIINIVTKRETTTGLQLALTGGVGYGYYPRNNQGINLSYHNKSITIFVACSRSLSNSYEWVNGYRTLDSASTLFKQNNRSKITGNNNLIRTGLTYSLNKNNEIGFQFKTNWYNENISQTNETNKFINQLSDSLFITAINTTNTLKNFSLNLNYKFQDDSSRNQLVLNADRARFTITSIANYTTARYRRLDSLQGRNTSLYSSLPYSTDIYTAKADYTHVIDHRSSFEGGMKTSFVNTLNQLEYYNTTDGRFDLDVTRSNTFRYREYVSAAYASLKHKTTKLDVQVGFRTEYTVTRGESYTIATSVERNYLNFFPSAFASYTLSPSHRLSVSYSRRIERPSYRDLNPFNYYLDPFSSLQGNPYLTPQYNNNFELSHLLRNKITTTLSYSHTTDVIMQVPENGLAAGSYVLKPANISTFNSISLLIGFPISLGKIVNSNFTFNTYHSSYQQSFKTNLSYLNNRQTTFEFNFDNQIKLPHETTMLISGYYISPFVQGYYRTAGIFTTNIGIKRSFLNQKLDGKLNVNDIFKSYRARTTSYFDKQTLNLEQVFNTRFINLSFSYKLTKGAKINPVKNNSGSQDEQKRVK